MVVSTHARSSMDIAGYEINRCVGNSHSVTPLTPSLAQNFGVRKLHDERSDLR